ncbi:MAG: hemolysin family protein [Oscillospiraceae bacterium]|nr:hemolysin family protein [Oscillospiraceae bacterium]
MIQRLIIIILLMTLSAFFSASETALTGVNRVRLKHKAKGGGHGASAARKALKLLEKYDRSLATLLIGNNIVNLAAASIATALAITAFPEYLSVYSTAISTAILTVAILIFAEVLPKSLAREHSEGFILAVAGLLDVLVKVLKPVSMLLLLMQRGASKLFANKNKQVSITEEELLHIIDEIQDEGVLEEHESDLVRSALELDETTVEEILTPRVDMVAVELNDSAAKVRDIFVEEGYSRLPVYDKTPDKVVGLISNKEFMNRLLNHANPDTVEIRNLIQEIVRLPVLMKLSEALKIMQKQKSHLAVVLDQHGGTEGIVTLEDILEELVGEIWDEGDEETQPVKFTGEDSFEVGGELSINDFNKAFEVYSNIERIEIASDSNTVGGWVFELFGKIPEAGESVDSARFKITVLSMDGRRIGRLRFDVKGVLSESQMGS